MSLHPVVIAVLLAALAGRGVAEENQAAADAKAGQHAINGWGFEKA